MRRLSIALVLASSLATACSPSIDPAAKADIDHRVAALAPAGQNVGKPSNSTPMPMAVGQWLTYKVTSDKGEPSFLTLKLVGQEGPAFWYETLQESYHGKTAMRMLVDFGDRKSIDGVTIKAAKLRDTKGRVTEYPENIIGLMNSVLRGNLGPIIVDWTGLPQEDVQVPAGSFAGCYKGRSEVTFAGFKSASTAWGHTAIPLSGMVRSQGDTGNSLELVGFGTSGARSEF
jgi:hypothetical protein